MDIHLLCRRNPLQLYSISELQPDVGDIKQHFMFVHAISGCDTVSAPCMKGKWKALEVLRSYGDLEHHLSTFTDPGSSHEDVANIAESFLLKLYGAVSSTSLNKHHYIMSTRTLSRSSLSSGFKLESLPPTTAAAKFHSNRAYLAVQQWMGNNLSPADWGRQYRDGNRDGILVTVDTVAPTRVLRLQDRLSGKAGLHCSAMCSHCNGQTCSKTYTLSAGPDSRYYYSVGL